jgi:adenylate kinase family enzyme
VRKVLVIGSPGAGKSVFSRRLGKITGLPLIHLDQHYWRPGWVEPSKEEWDRQLEELLQRDSWIIDGNYSRTMDLRLAYCDTAIFLDFPRHVCTWRVLKRSLGFTARPDLAVGCEEKVDVTFLKWTWNFSTRSRPGVLKRLQDASERISVVTLMSNDEVEKFLLSLASRSNTENGN